jgi:GDP-L-fucose synthase
VNIGAGFEVSIKNLVSLIVKFTGFEGEIIWDKAKPDGQPRRRLYTFKAYKEFNFRAEVSFKDGLKKTVNSYMNNTSSNLKKRQK